VAFFYAALVVDNATDICFLSHIGLSSVGDGCFPLILKSDAWHVFKRQMGLTISTTSPPN